ncbi:MAG: ATP-binding protein [Chelatococcus sp.]|nr:hybrid sensor histidine kinase/response regulator [Chelatococcus sp. HY11]MCO5074054.1 ATP-binding protein [Chelatococcus sp.]
MVLAPHGRDAVLAAHLLRSAGIETDACDDVKALASSVSDSVVLGVVTEEVLRHADLRGLFEWVQSQPTWSDLPFIILTHRGGGPERNPNAARLSETLGNVTFLERPFHATSFISMARAAVRGRLRQFEARSRIRELHESEERLRTALLAGRLGTWELNLSTRELKSSATHNAVYGRGAGEPFSYTDLLASIHPDDRDAVAAAEKQCVERGGDHAVEYRTVWPDGGVHWAEVHGRMVDDEGVPEGRIVGVSSDITERKSAEERLRRLNETLEERVAARAAENERAHATILEEIRQRQAAEELLRQAQKMEMIGQLTGGVAHDFNNLLMAVMANLDLLGRQVAHDAKAARLVDGALQGAQRGAALTQRLLAFARRQDLKPEPIDLAALVTGMDELMERSVGPLIELRRHIPQGLPLALLDANQIELALLNLIVNARDAMPEGGVLSITVDVAESADDTELSAGRYVRLSVSDTGHGMDEETLKKATEPFFSTKELGKGTGLGLSMIHGLAIQLGGALKLASAPGRGTTAELWLPMTTQPPPVAPKSTPVSERPAELPKATILVVDDDVLIAMSTVDMLEDLGHVVIEANSGRAALDILRSNDSVDLLITDFSMPQMNGAQLAKAALELRPNLSILLATGYAELPPGAGSELPRISKPYQQSQLASEIAKLLDRIVK